MAEQQWPDKKDIEGYLDDPNSIEKHIDFKFQFNEKYGPMPFAISSVPPLEKLDDMVMLLLMSTMIRTLAKRHGLGEALKKINDIAYGRIDGKRVFKIGGLTMDGPDPDPEDTPF